MPFKWILHIAWVLSNNNRAHTPYTSLAHKSVLPQLPTVRCCFCGGKLRVTPVMCHLALSRDKALPAGSFSPVQGLGTPLGKIHSEVASEWILAPIACSWGSGCTSPGSSGFQALVCLEGCGHGDPWSREEWETATDMSPCYGLTATMPMRLPSPVLTTIVFFQLQYKLLPFLINNANQTNLTKHKPVFSSVHFQTKIFDSSVTASGGLLEL